MKKRILYLDVTRIIACFMILGIHAPIPDTGLGSYVLSADSFLLAPGLDMFIMVSGALLLPVKGSCNIFLQKRMVKIACPTLFWTLFYMVMTLFEGGGENSNLLKSIFSIPLTNQFNGTFWYMYMLAGLYLLAPILSAWLKQATRQEIRFYLCLWGITLCYPVIRGFVGVNESYTGILYYFSGYVGYFLLGYYLHNYVERLTEWKCLLLILFPISIAISIKVLNFPIVFYDVFWLLSLFVAMMALAWFMFIKGVVKSYNNASRIHHYIVLLSNCCFGIYLVHIFIMRSVIWKLTWLHDLGIMQILLVTLMTFFGSLLVTWIISYLPGAEYIIGFRQKR